ncbi:MAG: NUDIX hydrolase [Gammaproteobacteria bacterium]|nr:MAG: NUDIX hydrolase [Gammaproteobacteria bacterium]
MPKPITPLLAVDLVIEIQGGLVLIERKNPPHGWALPGGFVDVGETLEQAAVREAREETALQVTLKVLLGCYSDPSRDPRGHTVSVVYIAMARGKPEARDDAASLAVLSLQEALNTQLAFDHARILRDYQTYKATRKLPGRILTPDKE